MNKLKYYIVSILLCLVMAGCSTLSDRIKIQVVGDSQIISIARPVVVTLAQEIKAKHPEDVDRYIRYCGLILISQDDEQIESYINIGINTLIDRNVHSDSVAFLLKSLKNMFVIDVDTDNIKFDNGALRTALDLVQIFKAELEK